MKAVAEELGDDVFVYKYRAAESGVSSEALFRQQVHWLRRAFELLSDNDSLRVDLMRRCERVADMLLRDVLRDATAADEFRRSIAELQQWLAANPERARRDAKRLRCRYLNAYDAFLEWILLDAFSDLANVPSALSGWMPEAAKRGLVVRQLDGKIAAARADDNEFQARYYDALKTLTPHLVVGFTSGDQRVSAVFGQLQSIVLERLYRPLFALDLAALPANDAGEQQLLHKVTAIVKKALIDIEQTV